MGVDFWVDKLLEPYSQAGTEKSPRKLYLEDISSELINRFKIPPDVAGAAIWKTFYLIAHNNLFFKDDGTFDGMARQLLMYMRNEANEILRQKSKESVQEEIVKITTCMNTFCRCRTGELKKKTKWELFLDFMMKPRRLFWIPTWRM